MCLDLSLNHDWLAGDKHGHDTLRVDLGSVVGGPVADPLWIKDNEIRDLASGDRSPILDAEARGRQGRDLVNRLFERQALEFAHVAPQEARERAIQARVWAPGENG